MKKLFLQAFFAFHELHVVNQQHVDFAITTFERTDRVVADSVHVFVEEGLGGDVSHFVVGVMLVYIRANCVQQVGFAKPCRTIDEQRVVGPTRCFSNSLRCSQRKLVRGTLHESVKGVSRVEPDGRTTPGPRGVCGTTCCGRCRYRVSKRFAAGGCGCRGCRQGPYIDA